MAITINTDTDFNVQFLSETVRGRFAGRMALMGSILASQGAIIFNDSFSGNRDEIGNEVTVPYFGTLGSFTTVADGVAATPAKIQRTNEKATVGRSVMAFEVSTWARNSGPQDRDPYEESADQIAQAAEREMDSLCLTAAAGTPLIRDLYSATSPTYLDWDAITYGRVLWGDEQSDIVAMAIHSRAEADLRSLRDSNGRPLLVDSQKEGELTTFQGVPLVISDRLPLTGSSMSAVTTAGSPAATITLSGTPTGPWNLKIRVAVVGALGTWKLNFSTDGGNTWSADILSAASVPLIDPAVDSLVGNNGTTGITASIGAGTADADDVYTSNAILKATSLILQKGACTFWFNRNALQLQTDHDILMDGDVAAMHMYRVAHRYRRRVGGTKPGVVAIKHNLRGFTS